MTVMMRHLKRNQRSSLTLWILIIGYFCGLVNHFYKAGMLQWVSIWFSVCFSQCYVPQNSCEWNVMFILLLLHLIYICQIIFRLSSRSELLSIIINLQVVMAVARVYHHLAPTDEVSIVARSLVRLLRSHRLDYILILNILYYAFFCIV